MRLDEAKPNAFLSYSRDDERFLSGGISGLRSELESHISAQIGEKFVIFQDVKDIFPGDSWREKLYDSMEYVDIFIPILTPGFFKKDWCRDEAKAFLKSEWWRGNKDHIIPIYLISAEIFENASLRETDDIARRLHERLWVDWRDIRFELKDPGNRQHFDKLAESVVRIVRQAARQSTGSNRQCMIPKRQFAVPRKKTGQDKSETFTNSNKRKQKNKKWTNFLSIGAAIGAILSVSFAVKELFKARDFIEIVSESFFAENPPAAGNGKLYDEDDILELQIMLREIGYIDVIPDGRMNSNTRAAIEDFQKRIGSKPTGEVTTEDLEALRDTFLDNSLSTAMNDQYQPRIFNIEPGAGIEGEGRLYPLHRNCLDCPEMVVIPAGSFSMGSPIDDVNASTREYPQHRVHLQRFALSRHEVTVGEYHAFVESAGRKSDGCQRHREDGIWENRIELSWDNPGFYQAQDHPVTCVSWNDANAYVAWLSKRTGEAYRLPSEAEWEFAARGGSTSRYFWGDDADKSCIYANGADKTAANNVPNLDVLSCNDNFSTTSPVRSFRPNSFGMYDMSGNVWEWVEDRWHENYQNAPKNGRAWNAGNDANRIIRGGSWYDADRQLRSAERQPFDRRGRYTNVGFRVAKTLQFPSIPKKRP